MNVKECDSSTEGTSHFFDREVPSSDLRWGTTVIDSCHFPQYFNINVGIMILNISELLPCRRKISVSRRVCNSVVKQVRNPYFLSKMWQEGLWCKLEGKINVLSRYYRCYRSKDVSKDKCGESCSPKFILYCFKLLQPCSNNMTLIKLQFL